MDNILLFQKQYIALMLRFAKIKTCGNPIKHKTIPDFNTAMIMYHTSIQRLLGCKYVLDWIQRMIRLMGKVRFNPLNSLINSIGQFYQKKSPEGLKTTNRRPYPRLLINHLIVKKNFYTIRIRAPEKQRQ